MTKKTKAMPLTPGALDILEERGIPPELASAFGVVSVRHKGDGEAIGFRHFVDGGEADHWTFRTIGDDKRFWQSLGTKRVLWGNQTMLDGQDADKPVIITEGHLDALSLMVAGFRRVMSVPDGAPSVETAAPQSKYDYLKRVNFENCSHVIIATDGDAPGQALREDLAIRIGKSRCKWVRWPAGCKDANDVLVKHDAAALVEAINGARWFDLDGLYRLDDLPELAPEAPWSTGIAGLDDLWRPSPGRMTVLTGIPGHGKSQLITDIACHLARDQSLVIAIGSFEDDVRGSLVPRLRQWFLGKDETYARDGEIDIADQWIRRHFIFIAPDESSHETPSVQWFIDRAEAAVVRHGARFVVLDPWNEVDHTGRPADVSQTEYVGVMLARLRRSAKTKRYHLLVAAHPAKLMKVNGKFPAPTGYQISDSANWVNKPDNGLTIHRDDKNGVEIHSWKARRDGLIGRRGKRTFKFNTQTARYVFDELAELVP